jgi:hypothetical protein
MIVCSCNRITDRAVRACAQAADGRPLRVLAVYGAFANIVATFLSAAWGAGAPMMPLAAGGHEGSSVQELVIRVLLVSLALADIAACVLVLVGLRRPSRG